MSGGDFAKKGGFSDGLAALLIGWKLNEGEEEAPGGEMEPGSLEVVRVTR